MIGQFDFSQKGWVSGKGRSAVWRDIAWERKVLEPQYLMARQACIEHDVFGIRLPLMNISSATNSRTLIAAIAKDLPCNHSLNPIRTMTPRVTIALAAMLNALVVDAQVRVRLSGLNVSFFVLNEVAGLRPSDAVVSDLSRLAIPLSLGSVWFADTWAALATESLRMQPWRACWAMCEAERRRLRAASDSIVASLFGLDAADFSWLLRGCDFPKGSADAAEEDFSAKGFWRVERERDPELRATVLAQAAFRDLAGKISECGGDREKGIEAFLSQNHGDGWQIPDELRLADLGLGQDDRATVLQPVSGRLGPRFLDWQLAQSTEESWRECDLHARNLLGESGYRRFFEQMEAENNGEPTLGHARPVAVRERPPQASLFD